MGDLKENLPCFQRKRGLPTRCQCSWAEHEHYESAKYNVIEGNFDESGGEGGNGDEEYYDAPNNNEQQHLLGTTTASSSYQQDG